MLSTIFLSFLLFFQTAQITAQPQQSPPPRPTPAIQVDEPPIVAKHLININGRALNYTTTTGFMPIKNRDGETEARLFFIAYTLDGVTNPKERPLMFSFNGGPGSSSVWLHLGALGPKQVKMQPNGFMPAPPYELVDNPETWLAETDLVFIDPVGTGYSRAARPELAGKFFGVQGDIESIGEFIRMYLVRSERWASPLFLVGESYGTTRAAGLSGYLFEKGIAFNGVLLVSSVLNFQGSRFADGNDLPFQLIFPSYTATAWYHKKLSANLQNRPLADVLRESEKFAESDLLVAMGKGDRLTAAEKQTAVKRFADLSGLSTEFIEQNNMRVELGEFLKELLRDQRRVAGRLDSRFTGIEKDAAGDNPSNDPSMSAIRTPYTATLNDYVRRDLGFKSDLEYYILGGGITAPWNWNTNNGYANTSLALREAMQKNPFMRVFVASGYYDMATPYFATEYTFANLNLDPTLRRNVSVHYYEAGHMMYIEENSRRKLKTDVTAFVQSAVKKQ